MPKLKGGEDEAISLLGRSIALETHCRQCYAQQRKYGIYPVESNLRREVIDLYTDLMIAAYVYEDEELRKRVEDFRRCCEALDLKECEKAIEYAGKIIERVKEIMKYNLKCPSSY